MKKYIVKDNKIEYVDSRFYKLDENTYIPSVTTVLSCYPKDYFFEEWLKNMGQSADIIRDRAAKVGSNVHAAIEKLLIGETITHESFSIEEWEMINKSVEFFMRYKPKNYETEQNLVSNKCNWAGTIDFKGEIEDLSGNWIIDFKTSNSVSESHFLQLIAYKRLAEVCGHKIDRIGILHLKANTRTEKYMQGKGWQLIEVTQEQIEELNPIWDATYTIFKHKMKTIVPKIKSFKTSLSL